MLSLFVCLFLIFLRFSFSVEAKNVALHMRVNQSDPAAQAHASLAVDGIFSTCTTFDMVISLHVLHIMHVMRFPSICYCSSNETKFQSALQK